MFVSFPRVFNRTQKLCQNCLFTKVTPHLSFRNLQNLSQFVSKRTMSVDKQWRAPAPCKVGAIIQEIDTPALVVDLDKLESNMQKVHQQMKTFPGVAVRPHAKAHKCPDIGKTQVEYGSVGLCCQTLVEAEAMVYNGGVPDVLVSNQLVGEAKLRRLAALANHAKVSICVDNASNIQEISRVAKDMGMTIDCVVEVNVGQDRCGVEPENAAAIAEEVLQHPNITLKGVQCYQGWNQHVRKHTDRKAAVDIVVSKSKVALQALKDKGIECDYVTGGGTGTFLFEAGSGIFTEVQPGSYIFMDADYGRNFSEDGNYFTEFQHSLLVLTAVQSVTEGDRAVVDAGMKAVSMDSGVPLVLNEADITYHIGGDEHGILRPPKNYKVGDLLWLIPGHCDPTVNLYDWIIGLRGNKVEALWPVSGRGPGV